MAEQNWFFYSLGNRKFSHIEKLIADWAVKTGYLQPYQKGLHLIQDKKTLWLIWNITGTMTVPRPIEDENWKYHVDISSELPEETKKQIENILAADGKKTGGIKK